MNDALIIKVKKKLKEIYNPLTNRDIISDNILKSVEIKNDVIILILEIDPSKLKTMDDLKNNVEKKIEELNEDEKAVYKTAFEIDQRWIVEMAADRTPYICQSQSINLYLSADIDKWDLMMLHWKAWELGIKSLYYCRSKSIQRASYAGVEADNTKQWPSKNIVEEKTDYEECLSCQ